MKGTGSGITLCASLLPWPECWVQRGGRLASSARQLGTKVWDTFRMLLNGVRCWTSGAGGRLNSLNFRLQSASSREISARANLNSFSGWGRGPRRLFLYSTTPAFPPTWRRRMAHLEGFEGTKCPSPGLHGSAHLCSGSNGDHFLTSRAWTLTSRVLLSPPSFKQLPISISMREL
jgi:hypothetical protein